MLKDHQRLIGHAIRDKDGNDKVIGLDDLDLGVRYQRNDKVDIDISCDSNYMVRVMPNIGKRIRECFHWIEKGKKNDEGEWIGGQTIYLAIDGAGGHGKKNIVEQYKNDLMDKYNIILVHQIPNSPETNVLNLGIWMSL